MLLFLSLAAFAWTSASSTTTLGPLTIAGLNGHGRHIHGGPPAQLGTARFSLTLQGDQPVSVRVSQVEYLVGSHCEVVPKTVRSTPVPIGLYLADGEQPKSVKVLAVSPGETEVFVGFEAVTATYTHCDRFAFRVTFEVESEGIEPASSAVVAETMVMRMAPARDR